MSPSDVTALRAELALNPLQLAERLGVTARLVLQWESGDRFPTKKHCAQMANLRGESTRSKISADSDLVSQIVRALLAAPEFERRLHALVAAHLNSASSSMPHSDSTSASGAGSVAQAEASSSPDD